MRSNKKQVIRLTESDLHRVIKESVKRALNEIGDTERGQYALGAAQARRDFRQQQAYERNSKDMITPKRESDASYIISDYASKQRAKANGGDEFNKDYMDDYYKAKDMFNANIQGYRNYMNYMYYPYAEDYRTAKIRH